MKRTAVVVALLCLLPIVCVGQTHLFPASDTNNFWTGQNSFSNTFSLTSLASGCLQVTSGVVNSTGIACGAGAGTVLSVTFTGDGTVLDSTPSSPVTLSGTLTATLALAPAGMVLNNMASTPAQPVWTNSIVIGLNGGGGYSGEITFEGLTGETSITVPNTAGASHTLRLPTDNGTPAQFLQTDGSNPAQLSWANAGTGTVTTTGSPAAHQPAVFSGATSITGAVAGAADTIFMGNDSGVTADPAFKAGPSGGTNGCAGSTDTPTYNTSTHAWGCHQITRASALYVAIPSTTRGDFTIAHGLSGVPNNVDVKMTSNGLIRFQPSPSPPWDATNVYLNASDDGLTGLLVVEP